MKKAATRIVFGLCLSAISAGIAAPAKALSFTVTTGQAAPGGEMNQGAFSEEPGVETITFNGFATGDLMPTTVGIASFSNIEETEIRQNGFAPGLCSPTAPCTFPDGGSNNESSYLSVGTDGSTTLTFSKALDYLGFNYGFADAANLTTILKQGTQTLGSFTAEDFFGSVSGNTSNQDHGYINLFADGMLFDTIVFEEDGNGRFEIDNIAYREEIPTPALLPGLIAMGAASVRKRRGELSTEES